MGKMPLQKITLPTARPSGGGFACVNPLAIDGTFAVGWSRNLHDPHPTQSIMKISLLCRRAALALIVLAVGPISQRSLRAQTGAPTPAPAPTAAAAAPAATPATKEDIVGTIKAAGNFKTFLKAAEAAGLLSTLQKPGPYTVFVPTDAAFAKLPAGTLDDLLKPESKAKLVTLLSYHLANGKLTGEDLSKSDEVKTLEGTEIDVDTSNDGKTIELDGAKVLGSDLEATNGIVHAIDAVLNL